MLRRWGALAVVGAAIALPASAAGHTKVVYAGGPPAWATKLQQQTGAGVNNFLINRVTIHAGDTVKWTGASLGNGFHTVDIPAGHGSDLPTIIPTGAKASGNDAGGTPFWFDGALPELGFNPALGPRSAGGTYNGSSRLDSGLPAGPPEDFSVKFTKPGVYRYFCDVHPGMQGYVVVKKSHAQVPTSRQDAKQLGHEELQFAKAAKAADKTKVHGNNVSLGFSAPGGVEVYGMFPSTLSVHPGTAVTFSMSRNTREVHTATFGPAAYVKTLSDAFQSSPLPGAGTYPSDPPGHLVLTQTSHGNGFANTGVLDRDSSTPLGASQTIRFTQPGTYAFICLIHPFMHGTIVVH